MGSRRLADARGREVDRDTGPARLLLAWHHSNTTAVTIDEVEIPHDGFVVIHATTQDGKPVMTQYVGDARVKAGFHQNVNVKLDQKPKTGATYVAMLYNDSGRTDKFALGPGNANVDKPLMLNGKEVSKSFKIDKAEK